MKPFSHMLTDANWGWRMSPTKVAREIYWQGYRSLAWSDLDKAKVGTRLSQERKKEILKEFHRIPGDIAAREAERRSSDLYAQLRTWLYQALEDDRCPRCKDHLEWGDEVVYLRPPEGSILGDDQERPYHAWCAVDELLD